MTINRNNIEAYLLDYLEGNLDPLLTADLMAFLAENPEYEKYIPDHEIHSLIADNRQFGYKDQLKRDFSDISNIHKDNFDEFCIAAAEGLLGPEDTDRLNEYIGYDADRQKNLELFETLKLQADMSIKFRHKNQLKKPVYSASGFRYLYYGLAIAASVALFLILTFKGTRDEGQGIIEPRAMNQEPGQTQETSSGNPSRLREINLAESERPVRVDNKGTRDKGQGIIEPRAMNQEPGQTRETSSGNPSRLPEIDLTDDIDQKIPEREQIILASLEPVSRELTSAIPRPALSVKGAGLQSAGNEATGDPYPNVVSENLLGSLLSRIDIWKTAETAISGFNYLTESQISISKTTDEQGKVTRLRLNTESYTIAGKLK